MTATSRDAAEGSDTMGGIGSGGHARSGPPPDPNALRRDRDAHQWTVLPPEGRQGPPPEWPLTEAEDRELELWDRFWRKPQAVMWERLGMQATVATYTRRFAEAEQPGASVGLGTLVRQLEDGLGISIPGMNSLRWKIGEDAAPQPRPKQPPRRRAGARDRFRVVDGA